MTKYIKNKDGKFAGSIGDGKTKVPSTAPTAIIPRVLEGETPPTWLEGFSHPATWTERPAELHLAQIPDYFHDTDDTGTDASLSHISPESLLPRPSAEVTDSWDRSPAQAEVEEDLTLMVNLVSTATRSLDRDELFEHIEHCDNKAAEFRNSGKYYQAQAYEWAALVGNHSIDWIRSEDPQPEAMHADAREISRGAVVMDYLPSASYHPTTASLMSRLLQ